MSFLRFVEGAAPGKRLKPNPKTDVDKKKQKRQLQSSIMRKKRGSEPFNKVGQKIYGIH